MRFYKSPGNTGTHVANLWTSAGVKSGERHVRRRNALRLAAGSLQRAGRHLRRHDLRRLVSHQRRPLLGHERLLRRARRRLAAAPCAVELQQRAATASTCYGASAFPTDTYNATNYWVDVVLDQNDRRYDATGHLVDQGHLARQLHGCRDWTTDEERHIPRRLLDDPGVSGGATLSATDAAYVTSHSLTISGLKAEHDVLLSGHLGRSDRATRPLRRRARSRRSARPSVTPRPSDFSAGTRARHVRGGNARRRS